jgi:hypothetical protein
MSNYVQIANLAASHIGTDARMVSPQDDRTYPRAVAAVWDEQRRATIRDGEWNFAAARAQLPALSEVVSYPFTVAYQMPAEALRLLEVLNDDARSSYKLEGRQILCDTLPPLYIRYAQDITDETLWDEQFCDAFAARLAWTLGHKIAGSAYDMTSGYALYKDKLNAAKSVDGRENPPLYQEESEWIVARLQAIPYNPLKWG